MNKPATMLREELGKEIDNLINGYLESLPAFIIRPIIQNVDRQLEEIEKRQLEADKKAYEERVFDKCFTTNLIYHRDGLMDREWYGEVNMCKYVALIIDTLNKNQSIGTLLNPVKKIHNILEKQNKNNQNIHGAQLKIKD